jgi:hypothetical protein
MTLQFKTLGLKAIELNPVNVILALLIAAGGFVGGYTVHDIQGPQVAQDTQFENTFEGQIKANVTQVDNEIQALKLEKDNVSMGQFRADCQDSQQYITEKYLVAGRDSGISQEERRLNGEYKAFLIESSTVIDIYLKKSNPDFTRYDYLRDKILLK